MPRFFEHGYALESTPTWNLHLRMLRRLEEFCEAHLCVVQLPSDLEVFALKFEGFIPLERKIRKYRWGKGDTTCACERVSREDEDGRDGRGEGE